MVEKTALAEAEVEYEDYTSDTVWVKFPVTSHARTDGACSGRRVGGHLDDHALDAARQPRHQLFGEDRLRPLQGHRCAGRQLGQGRRPLDPRRRARGRCVQAGARRRLRASDATSLPSDDCDRLRASAPRVRGRNGYWDFGVPLLPAIMSPTTPAPASCTRRPAMAARTSTSGRRMRATLAAAASIPRVPYTVDENRRASPRRRRASPASASSTTRARRATPTRR